MVSPSLRLEPALRARPAISLIIDHNERARSKPHGDEQIAATLDSDDSARTSADTVVSSTGTHPQHVSKMAVDPRVRGSFGTASSYVPREVVPRIRGSRKRHRPAPTIAPTPSGPLSCGEGVYSSRLLLDASDIAVYDVLATAFTSGS